jgi:HAD superfamily hydrolase (TIGR01509 family)
MVIKGLIFDFDGLILDTESPRYTAWCEIYQHFNLQFELSNYAKTLGSSNEYFDPLTDLAKKLGPVFDSHFWNKYHSQREMELLIHEPLMPGVLEYFIQAKKRQLKMAIASSSDRLWVISHLTRFKLLEYFLAVETAENVAKVKPSPDLYQKALSDLQLEPNEAIVFEDAPHGIASAKKAGCFCVAVPNPLSSQLDLSEADFVMDSFQQIPLSALLERIENNPVSS